MLQIRKEHRPWLAVAILIALLAGFVAAVKIIKYHREANVPVFVNKIGPFSNPSVAFHYYAYPLCKPEKNDIKHIKQNLVQKLDGIDKVTSLYAIKFLTIQTTSSVLVFGFHALTAISAISNIDVNQEFSRLCIQKWTKHDIIKLSQAIKQQFYYEFVLGELETLPIRGFLGFVDETTNNPHIYLHQHFTILYNVPDARTGVGTLIYANITSSPSPSRSRELTMDLENEQIEFTYSVEWVPSNIDPKHRVFITDGFFAWSQSGGKIHWLSILNSFLLVLLLAGFLALVLLRILRKDLARYEASLAKDSEDPLDNELEYGWKRISGDVFRFPPNRTVFCAFIGVGSQFVAMSAGMLFLALVGMYYPGNEGAIDVSALVLYALTAVIAGERSTFFYTHMGGTAWSWNVVLTATLFALPFFTVMGFLNTMSLIRDLVTAMHVDALISIAAIWLLIGLPLTLLGGIAGKRRAQAAPFAAPVRTKNFSREIPNNPRVYNRLPIQMAIGGLLPFGAIYLELYYVFDAVWGHAMFQLWGILAIVFILLLLVTACISVSLIFFQLSGENWKWWWNSFLIGGAPGIYIFIFAVNWWYRTSNMFGWMQWLFYFSQMAMVSYFFFIMLGTVSFFACLTFIRAIYAAVRSD